MREIKWVGLDLAKEVFQVHAADAEGAVVLRKRLPRAKVLEFFAQLPACTIVMEACSGAHYWGRQIRALGHQVRLIAAQYAQAYRMGNKHDRNDAGAICEAGRRPDMRFVPIKSEEQQSMMAAQGYRQLLVQQRTALVNHMRGRLAEFGIVAPRGIEQARALLAEAEQLLSEAPALLREVVMQMREDLARLDEAIAEADRRVQRCAQQNALCRRLMSRAGIGVQTAVALAAQIDPAQFRNGRHLSAFLGLVPGEYSSGNRTLRLSISKRGNRQLRTLLIHGARALVRMAPRKDDPFSRWIRQLVVRRGKHRAIVAAANKLARYVWVDMMQARQMGLG
jgi:transposase